MDDPISPHTHPALPNETHTVPVHYQRDPATPAAVPIVDIDTGTAVCGYDTSGPGWTLAAMAIKQNRICGVQVGLNETLTRRCKNRIGKNAVGDRLYQ